MMKHYLQYLLIFSVCISCSPLSDNRKDNIEPIVPRVMSPVRPETPLAPLPSPVSAPVGKQDPLDNSYDARLYSYTIPKSKIDKSMEIARDRYYDSYQKSLRSQSKISNFMEVLTIPYRAFLFEDNWESIHKSSSARSFVIFTHRPVDKAENDLYVDVCKNWSSSLESWDSMRSISSKNAVLVPLYWPTTETTIPTGSCDDLYSYNFGRAAFLRYLIGKDAEGVGPLLALYKDNVWYVMDISRFDPVDVKRAFHIWKQQLSNAKINKKDFNKVKFKEYFRSLLEVYGDVIVKVVKG